MVVGYIRVMGCVRVVDLGFRVCGSLMCGLGCRHGCGLCVCCSFRGMLII